MKRTNRWLDKWNWERLHSGFYEDTYVCLRDTYYYRIRREPGGWVGTRQDAGMVWTTGGPLISHTTASCNSLQECKEVLEVLHQLVKK